MNQDWVERDRLLTKIANDTEHIKETMNKQSASFEIHTINDGAEFKSIKKRIFYLTIAVVIIGVLLGGPSLAFMLVK